MKLELITYLASDLDVVNAARVSFAQQSDWDRTPCTCPPGSDGESCMCMYGTRLSDRDAGLVRFLLRERHGTPFEHGFFKFHVEAPIFVFREWHRHRVGHSYNEMSGRYTELEEKFYWPDAWRAQTGKPGAYTYEPMPPDWEHGGMAAQYLNLAYEQAWESYQGLLSLGVAKEQARAVLPLGIYSQMVWSCNPRSLMHFCGLRCAPQAQKEIRDLASAAFGALSMAMPVTAEAFEANGFRAP